MPEYFDTSLLQADIFSLGMIFFHVISGLPPGGHTISMETTVDTSMGHRPSFEFQEYKLLPHFKHLEESMTTSWQENPDDRMSAKKMLWSMIKPGFCCLCDYIEINNIGSGCVANMVNEDIKLINDTTFKKKNQQQFTDSALLAHWVGSRFIATP